MVLLGADKVWLDTSVLLSKASFYDMQTGASLNPARTLGAAIIWNVYRNLVCRGLPPLHIPQSRPFARRLRWPICPTVDLLRWATRGRTDCRYRILYPAPGCWPASARPARLREPGRGRRVRWSRSQPAWG